MTFTFAAAVAWDPIGNKPVKNTSFQAYAVTDTGFTTPLAITDTYGNPIAGNILNSGSQGVFPQFNQATNYAVVITDPAHTYAWTINAVMQDSSVAAIIGTPGSATANQLTATYASKGVETSKLDKTEAATTYVPKWKANTAYTAGDAVLSPAGDTVTAKVGFTSGASYSAANWNYSANYAPQATTIPKWVTATAYTAGQQVISPNGDVVSAIANHTSGGTFNSANWTVSTTFLARADRTSRPNTLASVQGAKGDFTGAPGATGAGTDNRTAIQAMLNAATTRTDSSYYGYLTAKGETVKLSGTFYISCPSDNSPSLTIPDWVTFDCTDADLVFQKPATANSTWCGIQLSGQNASIKVGRFYTEAGTSWPDTADVYDCIRIWQTDGGSRVTGNAKSNIRDFQGACIRGVGCWIPYVDNILFSNSSYGYIASNYYPTASGGVFGGALSAPSGYTMRSHTDLRMYGCQFVNLAKGGLVGNYQGKTGSINSADYTNSGLTITLTNCIFENIPAKAMDVNNALCLTIVGTDFEECGANGAGNGVIRVDTIRSVIIINPRINLAGRTLAGGYVASPGCFIQNTSTQQILVQGAYLHYTVSTIMKLTLNTPASFTVQGVYKDANDFASGPTYAGINQAMSGLWNTNHFALGGNHLWFDANGVLRKKSTAPTSDTDGTDMLVAKEINTTGLTSAQIDALFTVPTNGQAASDPTNGLMLVRQGGKWYKTPALTQIV